MRFRFQMLLTSTTYTKLTTPPLLLSPAHLKIIQDQNEEDWMLWAIGGR